MLVLRINSKGRTNPVNCQTFSQPLSISGAKSTILETEARLLREALDERGWNKKQAACRLGISRNTLDR
jgi:DNA-binding NtrC family response regulator